VVGVEKLSDFIDNSDRTISFLLGDGAGAVVIGPGDAAGIGPSVWGSDGSKHEAIRMTRSLTDVRDYAIGAVATDTEREQDVDAGRESLWPTMRQDGPTVFRWAVWEMAKVAQRALDAAGVTADDLAVFLPHQANIRIIDEMVKQLKLPEHVYVARDIVDAGNTSAASIPLAMHRTLQEQPSLSGKLALQIGFGAGLVFGAQVVVLP
jgi:3-oxoacyl-[acyl-carrier-protein] synthase-3